MSWKASPHGIEVRVFGILGCFPYRLQEGEGPISAPLTVFEVSVFRNGAARLGIGCRHLGVAICVSRFRYRDLAIAIRRETGRKLALRGWRLDRPGCVCLPSGHWAAHARTCRRRDPPDALAAAMRSPP